MVCVTAAISNIVIDPQQIIPRTRAREQHSVVDQTHVLYGRGGNGAAGEAATWTGRPEAERMASKRIKARGVTDGFTTGCLDFARHDN